MALRTTPAGIALIKDFEGLELRAYQDSGGIWTIGYGCTAGVSPGMTCTREQAEEWLERDIAEAERGLLACCPVHLNDNQFSALASFCFNVGFGKKGVKDGFLELKGGGHSTMLNRLLAGEFEMAADEFPKWRYVAGTPSPGILRRRMAEMDLFLRPPQKTGLCRRCHTLISD